jgi:hypothetical protein
MAVAGDYRHDDGSWAQRLKQNFTRAGSLWYGICDRCNPQGGQRRFYSSYDGVQNGFIDFDNFATWCQYQIGYKAGFQIDKDLLVKGNRFYAPDRCVFIPSQINNFIVPNSGNRGCNPIGVVLVKSNNKYLARCKSSGTGFKEHIGMFETPEEAFSAYKRRKEDIAKILAEKWKDEIDPRAYDALSNFTVNIND